METSNAFIDFMSGPNGFWLLFGLYVSMILIERLAYAFQTRHRYDAGNALGSFFTSVLSSLIAMAILTVLPIALYVWLYTEFRLIDPGYAWWVWIAAFNAHDLAYYIAHRIGHRTGFFWAIHHPHHSSEALNLTTASRGFPFGDPLQPFFLYPWAFLGIAPEVIVTVAIFKNLWGIFNHTPLVGKMGWLEGVLATPSNHRVHHGRNPQYIDKNYGQVLILWDRWLGTYEPEGEAPEYGVIEPVTSNNPLVIIPAGFGWLWRKMRACARWQDKIACLYRPPEWTPETGYRPGISSRTRSAVAGKSVKTASTPSS